MTTSKFLVEYEVESHSAFSDDARTRCVHPLSGVEIYLKNLCVEPGTETPLLSAGVLLEAADLETAAEEALPHLQTFLDHLAFVTNMRYQVHRRARVTDFTPGLVQRRHVVFSSVYGNSDLPYLLNADLLDTVEFLQRADMPKNFQRALRWYSRGVAAQEVEDQFQYFWLAIEVLSTLDKSTERVHQECPQCRGPLSCAACNKIPTHKRYPGQLIKQLFQKFIMRGDHEALFEDAQKVRHALAHGDDLNDQNGIQAEHVVDVIGRLAWTALFHHFNTTPKKPLEDGRLSKPCAMLQPNTFMHEEHQMAASCLISLGDPDRPNIDALPASELTREYAPTTKHSKL